MAGEDIAHLVEAANHELALGSDMQSIGAFAVDDYQRWESEKRILEAFVDDAAIEGNAVPTPDEWHNELRLVGEARMDLCNNAGVALKAKVDEEVRRLHSEQASLAKVQEALEDVKQSHESAEGLEHLTEALLTVKTLVDLLHEPEETLIEEFKGKITGSPEDIIEAGIKDLGQYYELVTLASHGFASFEELANYAKASVQNVKNAGDALEDVNGPYRIAKRDYGIPVA